MNRHRQVNENEFDDDTGQVEASRPVPQGGTLSSIKYAVRLWWHRHPASAATELVRPLLSDYARVHPFKLLGVAAAAGAAVVVIRPWRMVSASALVVAAVKSSGLTNTLVSMLSSLAHHSETTDTLP
jgi:hypothetical protein